MPDAIVANARRILPLGWVRERGFTLVELMITIAVAAILLAIATPSFTGVINSNRLVGQSNELVAALQIARSEAVRHNTRAIVCRSDDLATCTDGGNWTGWVAGLDTDRDGQIDQLLKVGNIKSPLQVLASANVAQSRVIFRPDGYAYKADGSLLVAALATCLPTDKPLANVYAVSITAGSQLTTKSYSGSGSCAAPADAP